MNWTEDDLKEIAAQLGNPSGEAGLKTAERMADNNANMTQRTIAMARLGGDDIILEIGPGNGSHVSGLLNGEEGLRYFGIDVSETMINEANNLNEEFVRAGRAVFRKSDGECIPFEDQVFTKIFTVNTLYFWNDPVAYAREIYRVLRPGGYFVLTITDKSFMSKLPFTQYGFTLYDRAEALSVLEKAGFTVEGVTEEIDVTTGISGQPVERDIILITASR
jgi:ubiquinone/menaquinone biosynthesis C-methylase UbiE